MIIPSSRRRFLNMLGLGAGAGILAPIFSSILREAHAAPGPNPHRVLLFTKGQGLPFSAFLPSDRLSEAGEHWDAVPLTTRYEPNLSQLALGEHASRMLLVDGLWHSTAVENQHSISYACWSGIDPSGSAEKDGTPQAETLDVYLGRTLQGLSPFPVVMTGISGSPEKYYDGTFAALSASGPSQPVAHINDPETLRSYLFGDLGAGQSEKKNLRHRLLMDSLRSDEKRLRAAVAGPERAKLDAYLAALEEFDARQSRLASLTCDEPPASLDPRFVGAETTMPLMMNYAALALGCGLTNVISFESCIGFHRDIKFTTIEPFADAPPAVLARLQADLVGEDMFIGDAGHGGAAYDEQQPYIARFMLGEVKRLLDYLAMIPEGDGTALDYTSVVFTSDNGEAHHAGHIRHPFVVIPGPKVRMRPGYVRYGKFERAAADLLTTLTHAFEVPVDRYGPRDLATDGTRNIAITGALPELLA